MTRSNGLSLTRVPLALRLTSRPGWLHDGGGVFVTLRPGPGNSLPMFMAHDVAWNDLFYWIIFEQGATGTPPYFPIWLVGSGSHA